MNDLAKKLNAGRLYYVKKKNGRIVIRQAHLYSCLRTEKAIPYVDFDDHDIEKVIAPVPTYEEVKEFVEEGEKLKKLLKECQIILQETKKDRGVYFNNLHLTDTLTEIEEVLK